jgi:hypothetical protein
VVKIKGDGNCLFRSIAKGYYGSEDNHAQVRTDIVEGILGPQRSYFLETVYDEVGTEELTGRSGVDAYVNYISESGSHGDMGCLDIFAQIHLDFQYTVWKCESGDGIGDGIPL